MLGNIFKRTEYFPLDIERYQSTQKLIELLKEFTTVALQSLHVLSLVAVELKPCFIELIQTFQTISQILKHEIIFFKSQNQKPKRSWKA